MRVIWALSSVYPLVFPDFIFSLDIFNSLISHWQSKCSVKISMLQCILHRPSYHSAEQWSKIKNVNDVTIKIYRPTEKMNAWIFTSRVAIKKTARVSYLTILWQAITKGNWWTLIGCKNGQPVIAAIAIPLPVLHSTAAIPYSLSLSHTKTILVDEH